MFCYIVVHRVMRMMVEKTANHGSNRTVKNGVWLVKTRFLKIKIDRVKDQ
jgi:hypothetical protein